MFVIPRHITLAARQFQSRNASRLSVVQGPSYPPLENKTLPDFFAQHILQKYNTRAALICPSEKPRAHGGPPSKNQTSHALAWDFEDFNRAIDAVARGLVLLGVQKGKDDGIGAMSWGY